MNDLYDLTLDRLGNLPLEVRIQEYSNFHLLTGVRISEPFVFPNEVRRLPSYSMSNGPLRRWRIVIEKAYTKLRENLSGFEPTTFAFLALATDGRSENLSYPKQRPRKGSSTDFDRG